METILIILPIITAFVGFSLGIALVKHNDNMARKLLKMKENSSVMASKILFEVNQRIVDVAVISNEIRVKETLLDVNAKIEIVRKSLS